MKSVLFLNLNQKKILDEGNVGVKSLTDEALRECLTATDYRSIQVRTKELRSRGNILFRFGFEDTDPDSIVPPVEGLGRIPDYTSLPDNIEIRAACPNKDTIVLWEHENHGYNTNDMFRQSMLNILTAMSTVLLFEELKQTKQFELCLVN